MMIMNIKAATIGATMTYQGIPPGSVLVIVVSSSIET